MHVMFPQEIEVWYILPALRKELAKELKRLGTSQTEIASKLGITKAAVSQYLSGKRANDVKFDKKMLVRIQRSAVRITKGASLIQEMEQLTKELWKTDFLCRLHKQMADMPDDCSQCMRCAR